MSSRAFFCSLFLAVLGSMAPAHATPKTVTNEVKLQNQRDLQEQQPVLESAEVDWQVVALRQQGFDHCPPVPGWDSDDDWLVQALRPPQERQEQEERAKEYLELTLKLRKEETSKLRRAIADEPLLKPLDRFCAYRKKTSSTPGFPTPPPLGLVKAAKSRMALISAGEPELEPAKTLAEHFLEQAAEWKTAPEMILPAGPARVRLVFLDTQPDQEGVPDSSAPSKHGYTLVHLADQLLCKGVDPCPVEFATRLALPHPNRDLPSAASSFSEQGGNLGLVEELAAAIVREVWNWRHTGAQKHLILNLSVGWDGEMLRELDTRAVSQLKPDTQLVYKALQFARNSGALVIAAAGNRRGGVESKWPILPAAWELRSPSCLPFSFSPKLIYAVGGVDWQGLPLPNYRHGGIPKRVAFGDHAVAQTKLTEDATEIYTGSSVSTAVVSSIAAAVWQLRPELRANEVMKLLDRSGNSLPSQADYYAWRDLWPFSKMMRAPQMERLSLCRAIARARGLSPIQDCKPWDPKTGAADLSVLVAAKRNKAPTFTSLQREAATLPSRCRPASDPSPQLFAFHKENVSPTTLPEADTLCPLYRFPDIVSQRWVEPQPDDPPCPGCSFVPPPRTMSTAPGDYVLAIQIGANFLAPGASATSTKVVVESAALDIDRFSRTGTFVGRTTYSIPKNTLVDVMGDPRSRHLVLVHGVSGDSSLANCTATLNFLVTSVEGTTYSVQNPVYVDPRPE